MKFISYTRKKPGTIVIILLALLATFCSMVIRDSISQDRLRQNGPWAKASVWESEDESFIIESQFDECSHYLTVTGTIILYGEELYGTLGYRNGGLYGDYWFLESLDGELVLFSCYARMKGERIILSHFASDYVRMSFPDKISLYMRPIN